MKRTPTMGPRGEGWVVLQVILLMGVAAAGWFGAAWDGPARTITSVIGVTLLAAGLAMAWLGVRGLGPALTPLPFPREGSGLVQTGIYGHVRHPIYGGIVLGAVGWALLSASVPALILAGVVWWFFRVKSGLEEVWLGERYPDYTAYRTRTRRLIPWIG